MKKGLIVAMTSEGVIGKGNSLPWRIPEDLDLFKKITLGNTVVMGRKTYKSIGKPLPGRDNIVVSSSMEEGTHTVMCSKEKLVVCRSLEEAIARASRGDIFFIGGAKVYEQALMIVDEMYISWVRKDYEGDVHFPKIDFYGWKCDGFSSYDEFVQMHYVRRGR